MGLIAHRQRWLITPLTGLTSAIYTIPSISSFLLLLPITGRGNDTGDRRADRLHARDHLAQRHHRPGRCAPARRRRRARDGPDQPTTAVQSRITPGAARDPRRAADRGGDEPTVGLAAFAYLAGAGGLGANIDADIDFRGNVLVCGVILTLLAAALDFIVLSVQRFLTPWRRAVAT